MSHIDIGWRCVQHLILSAWVIYESIHYLLKWGSTQLNGDVLELTVPLSAEVADDVRVLVWLPQQLNFSVRKAEALWENSLHCHWTVVKLTPCGEIMEMQQFNQVIFLQYFTHLTKVINRCWLVVQTYLYTMVPSAPWPKTSLGWKVMLPTRTTLESSSDKRNKSFQSMTPGLPLLSKCRTGTSQLTCKCVNAISLNLYLHLRVHWPNCPTQTRTDWSGWKRGGWRWGCCGLSIRNECGPPPGSRCLGPSPSPRLQWETAAASGAAPTSPPSVSGTPDAAAAAAYAHSVTEEDTTSEVFFFKLTATFCRVSTFILSLNFLLLLVYFADFQQRTYIFSTTGLSTLDTGRYTTVH